jgi:hypothetical protein
LRSITYPSSEPRVDFAAFGPTEFRVIRNAQRANPFRVVRTAQRANPFRVVRTAQRANKFSSPGQPVQQSGLTRSGSSQSTRHSDFQSRPRAAPSKPPARAELCACSAETDAAAADRAAHGPHRSAMCCQTLRAATAALSPAEQRNSQPTESKGSTEPDSTEPVMLQPSRQPHSASNSSNGRRCRRAPLVCRAGLE